MVILTRNRLKPLKTPQKALVAIPDISGFRSSKQKLGKQNHVGCPYKKHFIIARVI